MSSPNRAYRAGQDWDRAIRVNSPSFSAPFPGVNVDYILKQDFMQNAADFMPLPLGTQHPDFPDFVLVEEPDKPDQGALVFRWTRTYAKTPDSYTEPGGTYGYTFIGFVGQNQTSGLEVVFSFSGRERFTLPVGVQITKDFFLVGPIFDSNGNNLGTAINQWEDIPTVAAQRYFITLGNGEELDIDYINAAAANLNVTTPTREDYNTMMANDAATGSSYSLVIETAYPVRWMGNIFLRETKKIKAL